jgi:predicted RNA methylase
LAAGACVVSLPDDGLIHYRFKFKVPRGMGFHEVKIMRVGVLGKFNYR